MSAKVDYYIRSPTKKTLKPLTEKVLKCFEAAATATGCKVEFEWYGLLSLFSIDMTYADTWIGALLMTI
jgi:metal-dependent amidase/aminoacylase/carboxypeptidase family protein